MRQAMLVHLNHPFYGAHFAKCLLLHNDFDVCMELELEDVGVVSRRLKLGVAHILLSLQPMLVANHVDEDFHLQSC